MTWVWIGLMALAALMVGLFVLRIPRNSITALAAALAVGLAGYSWQGSPSQPESFPVGSGVEEELGDQIVTLRRQILAEEDWSENRDRMITADAFARMGQFEDASEAYGIIVRDDPEDAEAWLALGNALVNHADGAITPPAVRAFRKSEEVDPDTPGVPFFIGLALIQQGDFLQARGAWAGALKRMPEGSDAHGLLSDRLQRLDNLINIATGARPPAGLRPGEGEIETPNNDTPDESPSETATP